MYITASDLIQHNLVMLCGIMIKSRSTLHQVVGHCLITFSHYLVQCRLNFRKITSIISQFIPDNNDHAINHKNAFRINVYIMKFSGPWPLAYVHALVLVKWVNIGSDTYLATSRYLENWFAANLRFTTYFNKILLKMKHVSFTKMHLKLLTVYSDFSVLKINDEHRLYTLTHNSFVGKVKPITSTFAQSC